MSGILPISRRTFLAAGATVCLSRSVIAGGQKSLGDPCGSQPWRVGTGRRDITPPLEVGILMSSGRQAWAPFEGVRFPLYATALVIDNGRTRVALVALDLLGLAGEAVGGMDQFKRRVSQSTGGTVAAERIVLASSHTHSGPESLALTDLYRTKPFQDWVDILARRIGEAVHDAGRSLQTCRLAVGTVRGQGLCVNRRLRLEPGPTDEQIRVVAFLDRSGRPAAILVNATAHPVYEMCIKQVSPDYPGELVRLLESRHPQTTALFLQGACGNINPPRVSTGATDSQHHARQLADRVDHALGKLRPVRGCELAIRWDRAKLPARDPAGKRQAEPLLATVGALRLGDAAMVFLPGEPFVELGLRIQAESPFDFTAIVGYAEGYIGYVPTDRAFQKGGYECGPGRWSRTATGSESLVVQTALTLLKSLKKRSSPPSL
ncbi:MAG: hypothetical protein GXP27_14640 [Planctomycetes bacterium]|nr:hypothetical protein [Planctomycetota bacterium]